MSIDHLCNRVVRIERQLTSTSSSKGSNFNFLDGNNVQVVIESYPCYIKESVGYRTSAQGDEYEGRATMYGLLTNKIQEGDIVDQKWKIVGEPLHDVKKRVTQCSLARL